MPNTYPIYTVPFVFAYQHILLLAIMAGYVTLMCFVMRRRTKKTQRLTMIIIMSACCVIFAGRMLFGFEGARIYNRGSKTTLLPFELCNLNIVVTLVAVVADKKWLSCYLFYISMVGALFSLTVFPPVHMYPKTLLDYMFFDYFLIHSQLVMVPLVMLTCGWYRPERSQIKWSMLLLVGIYTFDFLASLILRNFEPFAGANWMYVMYHNDLPILKQLWSLIPVPYLYGLALGVGVYGLLEGMTLPFTLIMRRRKTCAEETI